MVAMATALYDQLDWEVDVGMRDSVGKGMRASKWEPSQEDRSRWGMDGGIGGLLTGKKKLADGA